MLRSVQRLERRGGFRPRLLHTRRDYLRYLGIAKIQGNEAGPNDGEDPHERWEYLLRHIVHGAEEGPE